MGGVKPLRTVDAEIVISRLATAGETLFALPANGPRLGVRVATYGALSGLADAAKGAPGTGIARPPVPDAAAITAMDEAYRWLTHIGNATTRRIVAMRSLTRPHTGRAVFSWAKVGEAVGADYRAAQRWHAEGIEDIARALRAGQTPAAASG